MKSGGQNLIGRATIAGVFCFASVGAWAQLSDATSLRGLTLGVTCDKSQEQMRTAAPAAGASVAPGMKFKGADEVTPVCTRGPDESLVAPRMVRFTRNVIQDEVRVDLNPVSNTVDAVRSETIWFDLPNGVSQKLETLEAALIAKFGKPAIVGKSGTNARMFAFHGGAGTTSTVTAPTEQAFEAGVAKLPGPIATAEMDRSNGRVTLRILLKRQVTEPPAISL